ncbi:TRAP transporter substrate-binding protein [Natronospirillum operosum]|uniref:TRAP transporter substrate-binding protein n=2 Tax=Natronospirillum operosum TaxID=2759953 RepID=A0A4Z0WBB8_9GAMM|nr:TRAP transporter substrate-binding protein [Natronospirillum operosum]
MTRTITAITLIGGFAAAAQVQAQEVTLRLAHLWPEVSGNHQRVMQAWADQIEEESNGRIAVEVYPGGSLVPPPDQYDAVSDRIVDVTATVQGYTANRFPLTQIVELPGVSDSGAHGACILQSLYDEGHLDAEYEDTHPLFMFTHGPGMFHVVGTEIREPSDLQGLRIRRPTTVVGNILEELGAQAVGMPAPESYTAMQRGVIDGVALPWEATIGFRLAELVDSHTEIAGMYTLSFIMTMNRGVYESMSAENRAVIDANSGLDWAVLAGEVFDDLDQAGIDDAMANDRPINVIEGGTSHPDWAPAMERSLERYLSEVEERGLPAREVYDRAMELRNTCDA